MNLFDSSLNKLFRPSEKRAAGDSVFSSFFNLMPASTQAGKKVNANTSFKIAAFWCGVNTICNSIALLPKHIYISTDNQINRVPDHPADFVIHSEANKMMTSTNFWASFTMSALVKGDGFALIDRTNGGEVAELILWDYDDVTVHCDGRNLFYKHSGRKKMYLSDEVLHIPGFGFNGVKGKNVVAYAADNLGLSISADQFGTNAYDNKGVSYGVIESDREVDNIGKTNIRNLIKKDLQDVNKHKIAVLDEGMKYKSIALLPNESQFIEAKASGVEDIARWLNIPLHKLHTKGEGGYNFLIQMGIEYQTSAVMPWGQKIKEEIQRKLLTKKEKQAGMYCFMNYRKLLEADPKARAQYYKDMVFMKSMNPNEVRAAEDMNPYDGGEEFLQMTNLQTPTQIQSNDGQT